MFAAALVVALARTALVPAVVAPTASSPASSSAASSSAASSSAAGDPLTLEELLVQVRDRAPALTSARASLGVVASDEEGAAVWPNPSASYNLSATLYGADSLNGQQHALELSQPLLLAGQPGARASAAKAATRAGLASLRAAAADLERDARAAFDDLLVAQARVEVSRAALHELVDAERVVDAREQDGAGSRYDALRIAAAVAGQEAALGDDESKLIAAQGQVAALVGRPGYAPRAVADLVAGAMPEDAFRADHLWALTAAHRRVLAKKSALTRAEREAWPVPTVAAGAFASTSGFGVAFIGGIQSAIPVFDRNQGAIAHARAEVVEAEAEEAQARAELESGWRAARAKALRADRALKDFEARTGEKLGSLRTMARDGYASGKQSILELVDAEDAIVTLELQRVELVGAARRTRLELLHAGGALGEVVWPPRGPGLTGDTPGQGVGANDDDSIDSNAGGEE